MSLTFPPNVALGGFPLRYSKIHEDRPDSDGRSAETVTPCVTRDLVRFLAQKGGVDEPENATVRPTGRSRGAPLGSSPTIRHILPMIGADDECRRGCVERGQTRRGGTEPRGATPLARRPACRSPRTSHGEAAMTTQPPMVRERDGGHEHRERHRDEHEETRRTRMIARRAVTSAKLPRESTPSRRESAGIQDRARLRW